MLFCILKTSELLFQNRKIGLNIHLAHKIIFIVVYSIFSLAEELEFSDFRGSKSVISFWTDCSFCLKLSSSSSYCFS